ncbi:MAG: CvpA family protein [Planctomycetes bacterium]|nr:CvpA family protein [Planctomycetota bacterium]
MLTFITILIMIIVAYAQWREGLYTACCTLVNVVLAGLITFNFWEPLADILDSTLQRTFLSGYEDFFVLIGLFAFSLGMLRMIANNLCPNQVIYIGYVQQAGGAVFGLLIGYLAAGFLLCALETLPWHESFMSFEPRLDNEASTRSMLPADRVWLSLMRYAGAHSFSWNEDRPDADDPADRYVTFDRGGTFELRYWRYRRNSDTRQALPYQGEFNWELHK